MSQAAAKTADTPAITAYKMVGGEAGLRRIVNRFYEIMESDPDAASIRAMHGKDLGPIKERLFEFMSGWFGGPPLYHERTDRRCIVSAHAAFTIDASARDQWLACMRKALADCGMPEAVCTYLDAPMFRLADFFRNR